MKNVGPTQDQLNFANFDKNFFFKIDHFGPFLVKMADLKKNFVKISKIKLVLGGGAHFSLFFYFLLFLLYATWASK